MNVSSLLSTVLFCALFSAVAELLVPWRFSGIGRLLRALSAVVLVCAIASPVLSFVSNGTALLQGDRFWDDTEGGETTGDIGVLEEEIVALSFSAIEEQIKSYAIECYGAEIEVEIFVPDDITEAEARIYWRSEDKDASAFCRECTQKWGISCTLVTADEAE